MVKAITFLMEEDVLEKLRAYTKSEARTSKALSGTLNKILIEYLNKKEIEQADPKKPAHTHTESDDSDIPDKRIMKTLEWIEKNNPTGITKKGIEEAIKETKGMDNRTVKKYMPIVQDRLRAIGYSEHPANHLLLIRA